MILKPQFNDVAPYLEATHILNFNWPNQMEPDITQSFEVVGLADDIMIISKDEIDFIKNAFEYVRDNISHSADIMGKRVTCTASEVLMAKEGICYAKSHLLAAILRANLVPTGFCYQRLVLDDETAPYHVLHGLNAVYIEKFNKWIRLDPRGNKQGINAQFSLEREQLAFNIRTNKGEEDIPIIYAKPDKNVVRALTGNRTLESLWSNLPTSLYEENSEVRSK
ncbi:MAG: transglutaminase family protein [Defluviitaleaceae bacterium]|nr:transglutaminase family protein [Defluviitaleaceae bacterium]